MVGYPLARWWSRRVKAEARAADFFSLFPEARDWEIADLLAAQKISMTSPERLWAVSRTVQYLEQNDVSGDFVECGVWRGGSSFLMAQTLSRLARFDRDLYLFDTFEGMPESSKFDRAHDGRPAASILKAEEGAKASSLVWAVSPYEEVLGNMRASAYPEHRFKLVKGDVRTTLLESAPDRIALARLDTDWYESTRVELEILMPRMVKGGIVIVDDYGHWSGSRKAVDEWFASLDWKPLIHRIDYTGRMWVVT